MSILIVDDEAEILETLKGHFALEGIKCTTSTSAKQALEMHRDILFPVIMTDIRMPEMNGVDFTRQAKLILPTSQIYVMTGYATLLNLAECLGLGACDYFKKPFQNIEEVTKTVIDGLKRHQRWVKDLSAKKRDAA